MPSDAKMTAEDRLRALPGIGPHADLTAPFWRQLPSTVIWLMEAHAAAAVAEVAKERDQLREDVERCAQVGWYGLVEIERKNASQHYGAALALAQNRDRAVCRAEQSEARVAELEAALRNLTIEAESIIEDVMDSEHIPGAGLGCAIGAANRALAPQAPPARKEGE